jgi:hypothetical protein
MNKTPLLLGVELKLYKAPYCVIFSLLAFTYRSGPESLELYTFSTGMPSLRGQEKTLPLTSRLLHLGPITGLK